VNAENSRRPLSSGLRIAGAIVILATAIVIAVGLLGLLAPGLLTYSRHAEGWVIRILVTSLIVCGVGGLFMAAQTKNPLWLLSLLLTGGMVALWLLIAGAMGPLMH